LAVKIVHVSDLSGKQAEENDMGKLIVHEHPNYQSPITLEVLPDEIGDLPEAETYVSIEYIPPGERSGQRTVISVERFNKMASSGDMNTILMDAAASHAQPQAPTAAPRRRGRSPKTEAKGEKLDYSQPHLAGNPHRGRVSPEEAAYVRDHFDEVNARLSREGLRMLDPSESKIKQRYSL
jgi:hypothetical protein